MSPLEIGLTSLGAMVLMVYLGFWLPFSLMLSSFIGVWMIKGSPILAGKLLALAASETISSYFFGVVPLFIMMGFIVSVTGMGRDAFDVANHIFRRIRGGLGIGTVGANAIFAAITGISIASAAVFTRIAVPEMIRHGYKKRFSVGVVAGSSNKISKILIHNLSSSNKNIRGFTSLVLANRNEKIAIPEIIKLIKDEHEMVRSCAIGALGYLKADKITDIILKLLSDSNLEVQKSALQAAIQVNAKISKNKIEEISKNNDQQIKNLLLKLKKISGPEGI